MLSLAKALALLSFKAQLHLHTLVLRPSLATAFLWFLLTQTTEHPSPDKAFPATQLSSKLLKQPRSTWLEMPDADLSPKPIYYGRTNF